MAPESEQAEQIIIIIIIIIIIMRHAGEAICRALCGCIHHH